MGGSWVEERFEDYKLELNAKQQCLSAWEFITLVGSGHFSKGMDRQALSMGIGEVYQELIMDVLKQVGHTSSGRSTRQQDSLAPLYTFTYIHLVQMHQRASSLCQWGLKVFA